MYVYVPGDPGKEGDDGKSSKIVFLTIKIVIGQRCLLHNSINMNMKNIPCAWPGWGSTLVLASETRDSRFDGLSINNDFWYRLHSHSESEIEGTGCPTKLTE